MQSWSRRYRAQFHYLKKPILDFLPLLALLIVVLVAGTICFKTSYQKAELGYVRSLYITYCLIFMEHVLEFPDHWVLQVFYLVLPPLGMVVVLDGVVRFSYHVLRRDETGKEWAIAMTKTLSNHVVLCGLGKVGFRVLQQLLQLGEQVVVLEKRADCPNLVYARKLGVPVHIGCGREPGLFDDLDVANAKSMILATDDDLANLEMALDARRVKPKIRVVMRMFDQELAAKIHDAFDIHLAFSTSELAAPLFATSSCDRSITNAFYVGVQLLVVANLVIRCDSELIDKKISELGQQHHIFVISHTRNGESLAFPPGDATFSVGDRIIVQTEPDTLKLVHQMNRDPEPY